MAICFLEGFGLATKGHPQAIWKLSLCHWRLLSVPDEVYEAPTEPSELPLEPPEPGSLGRLVAEFFAFAASFRPLARSSIPSLSGKERLCSQLEGTLQSFDLIRFRAIQDTSPIFLKPERCVSPQMSAQNTLWASPCVDTTLETTSQWVPSCRWDSWVASVRLGAVLPRSAKSRAWRVAPLCVEDPFETHLNTCRRLMTRRRLSFF